MRTPTVPGLADGSGLTSALRLKLRTRPHDKMDGPYSPLLFAPHRAPGGIDDLQNCQRTPVEQMLEFSL